jgi:hypothetical protein
MKKRSPHQPRLLRRKETAVADFAVLDLARVVIERVEILTKMWGPTRAYIAVMTTIGLAFLHGATDINLAAVAAFIVMALVLPLLAPDHPGEPMP